MEENTKKILIIIFEIILLCAFFVYILCFKYELTSTNENIYRINKITGNVQQIKGSRFVPVDKINLSDNSGLNKLKKMEQVTINKNIDCNLSILWRDNNLYYNYKVSPFDGEVKKIRESSAYGSYDKGFTIQFYDMYGFVIATIPVKIQSMTGLVDENGKIVELQEKGKISLSYEEAKNIDNWSVTWNF